MSESAMSKQVIQWNYRRGPLHKHRDVLVALLSSFAFALMAIAQTDSTTPQFFDKSIRPLLNEYCLKCHSTEKHKGDLDLERFSSLDEVKKHPKVWQGVVEQLAHNEMPPKDKPQPPRRSASSCSPWVNAVLDEIALARAPATPARSCCGGCRMRNTLTRFAT